MAANTVSQNTSVVQDSNPIRVDFLNENTPAVSSLEVARHFQRRHSHILREIDRLRSICPKSFNEPNFGRVEYADSKGEKRPAFLLTRDAFSLLVMGFTGSAAIRWKLRYIEAFNALERAALENHTELALDAGRRQALDEAAPQRRGCLFAPLFLRPVQLSCIPRNVLLAFFPRSRKLPRADAAHLPYREVWRFFIFLPFWEETLPAHQPGVG